MKHMDLSIRMKAVTDMVPPGSRVADIGCDHAFIPIYLIEHNIAETVIASDVRKGPVDIAKKNIAAKGLSDVIDVRLVDGLKGLNPGEADTVVLAGMGGRLIVQILSESPDMVGSLSCLVLQPQSDVRAVRTYLKDNGWQIVAERMVRDAGKYYVIMRCEPQVMEEELDDDLFMTYGRYMLEHRDETFHTYLNGEQEKISNICRHLSETDGESARTRIDELQYELKLIERALAYFTVR